MTARSKSGSGTVQLVKVLKELDKRIESLPSDGEVRDLNRGLQVLIDHLGKVQVKLEAIPNVAERDRLLEAIRTVLEVLDTGRFGWYLDDQPLKKNTAERRRSSSGLPLTNVKQIMLELDSVAEDQLLVHLGKCDRSTLLGIAGELEMRVSNRDVKDNLARDISTRMRNLRSYRGLRGQSPEMAAKNTPASETDEGLGMGPTSNTR